MKISTSTATRIVAASLLSISLGYTAYLNNKPQLSPHEARTHAILLQTYQVASRALLFPGLPAIPLPEKQRQLDSQPEQNDR